MFTWNQLRFTMTTTQLKSLARNSWIDVSHIIKGPKEKRELAEIIASHLGIESNDVNDGNYVYDDIEMNIND